MPIPDASAVVAQVAPDFQKWEKDQMTWLAQQMGGKGNVIALRGIAGTSVDGLEWPAPRKFSTLIRELRSSAPSTPSGTTAQPRLRSRTAWQTTPT